MKSNFFFLAILFVVAFFAFSNVGGIFPTKLNTTGAQSGSYVMVTPVPGSSDSSLQLKLVKFKGCSTTAAVNFLVDRSGSMAFGKKLPLLQKGLLSFANKLSDQSVFGLQTFAEDWTKNISPGLFSDVKGKITDVVCKINPNGGTHTKDAFVKTKGVLEQAQITYPDHNFALIFISDGIPETLATNTACPGGQSGEWCGPSPTNPSLCRCFAQEQDPTQVADQIKAMGTGIKIYTIAYVEKEDQKLNNKLQEMMKRVATTPNDAYMAPNETEIVGILNKISNEICTQ